MPMNEQIIPEMMPLIILSLIFLSLGKHGKIWFARRQSVNLESVGKFNELLCIKDDPASLIWEQKCYPKSQSVAETPVVEQDWQKFVVHQRRPMAGQPALVGQEKGAGLELTDGGTGDDWQTEQE